MRKADWIKIGALAIIFAIGMSWSYQILKPKRVLPIFNPAQLDERLVDESIQGKGLGHTTLPFALLNQYGDSITEADAEDTGASLSEACNLAKLADSSCSIE